ncbi:hypothetical protein HY605_03860 [Candidatus Peregrinibacteria bacterium]|nr:hypothetical protein [Candidatus Peregrinibacteria bacterium]
MRTKKAHHSTSALLEQEIIRIDDIGSEKLILSKPLSVVIKYNQKDDIYAAEQWDLNLYGEGKSDFEAVEDLKKDIEEFYFELKEEERNLGVQLQKRWGFLKRIVEEK